MKFLIVTLFCFSQLCYAQLSIDDARSATRVYEIGSYSYHEQFQGYTGYAAPVIQTADGGAAVFGDVHSGDSTAALLVKLDKNAQEEWKVRISPEYDDMESQSVVQDQAGNYFVFMLSYDDEKYRGGSQRVVYISQQGKILWSKLICDHNVVNNPIFSYIHALPDGRINLRGHIVIDQPKEDEDPVYYNWEGWIDSKGVLTQEVQELQTQENWDDRLKPGE